MARAPRQSILVNNGIYYIVQKGNNGENVFNAERDYQKFLDSLQFYKEYFGFFLYAFVLLPKQISLLIEVKKNKLPQIMHRLNTSYALYFNNKHKRAGHLFHGRYQANLLEKKSFLLNISRQMHLLPMRFGINETNENYKWGSLYYYLNGNNNNFIDTQEILSFFKGTFKEKQNGYRSYVNLGQNIDFQHETGQKNILGSSDFISWVKEQIDKSKRKMKLKNGFRNANEFIRQSYFFFNRRKTEYKKLRKRFKREQLKSLLFNRSREASSWRHMCMYVMGKHLNLSLKQIARHLSYASLSMISYGIRNFEEKLLRDEELKKKVDRFLKNLKIQ